MVVTKAQWSAHTAAVPAHTPLARLHLGAAHSFRWSHAHQGLMLQKIMYIILCHRRNCFVI